MRTDVQVFGNNFTAAAAHLRCVLGINPYHTSTSTYRLVRSRIAQIDARPHPLWHG